MEASAAPACVGKRKRDGDDPGDAERLERDLEGAGQCSDSNMTVMAVACDETVDMCGEELTDQYFQGNEFATDDVTGKPLDAPMVRAAREDELAELKRLEVYDTVDLEECWRLTGRAPVTARWIDTNKGDDAKPKYRSRFVAREIRGLYGGGDREDLFAATPPWEAVKMLLSDVVTGDRRCVRKLMFIDIGKAYLFAPVTEQNIFVDLPPEQAQEGKCGRLKKALYGTRDAAKAWEMEYNRTLASLGFVTGLSSTCVFHHPTRGIKLVVHGDDFTLSGDEQQLHWFAGELEKKYIVKVRGVLGPGKNDQKEILLLNRVIEWTDQGIQIEADPRHVELILAELGLESAKSLNVTGSKTEDVVDSADGGLSPQEATRYRSIVARANYMAADRPDIQYAVKELCRDMGAPSRSSWCKLKKLGRYLRGSPRLLIKYGYQGAQDYITIYADSDYAGCRRTRRSTGGGCAMVGGHCVKTWSTTQSIVALSSGEAEYYALVKAACVGLGLKALYHDFTRETSLLLMTDSTAARGMCHRRGLGKVRHMDVQMLWLQQKVQNREVGLKKVAGKQNLGDLLTKYTDAQVLRFLIRSMSMAFSCGRSGVAPLLQGASSSTLLVPLEGRS